MTKSTAESSLEERANELLAAGATAELRLLKQERKAEQTLIEALAVLERDQQRLARALHRVERGKQSVNEAEAALRGCQTRRAAGPTLTPVQPESS